MVGLLLLCVSGDLDELNNMSRAETLLNLLKMTLKDISKMDELKSGHEVPDESDTLEMKLFSDFVDH